MNKAFLIYHEWKIPIQGLSLSEKGQLLDCLFAYSETKTLSELTPLAAMAFNFLKQQIDRDEEKYIEKCERNQENGGLGGRPKKNNRTVISETERLFRKPNGYFNNPNNPNENENENEKINKKEKEKSIKENRIFRPPTMNELIEYCESKNYHFSVDTFYFFYESKGWMVGKTRMKSWRSACVLWEGRHVKEQKERPQASSQYKSFDEIYEKCANKGLKK